MTAHWSDFPIPKPEDEISTPLGTLRIVVHGQYMVCAELNDFVLINRILCRVTITSYLNRQTEDWYHACSVDRVIERKRPGSCADWEISKTPPTEAARKKARAAVMPLIEQWVDTHVEMIEQGRLIGEQNLIARAHARLDHALHEITARRAELERMAAALEQHGSLNDLDRRLLDNVNDHHWRF